MENQEIIDLLKNEIQLKKELLLKLANNSKENATKIDSCHKRKKQISKLKKDLLLAQKNLIEVEKKSKRLSTEARKVLLDWAKNELSKKIEIFEKAQEKTLNDSYCIKKYESITFTLRQQINLEKEKLNLLESTMTKISKSNDKKIREAQELWEKAFNDEQVTKIETDNDFIESVFGKHNFFGTSDWQGYYNIEKQNLFFPLPVSYEELSEIAESECPFTPGEKIKDTHFLHLSLGSISFYNWLRFERNHFNEDIKSGGLKIRNEHSDAGWRLSFKNVVPASLSQTWDSQNKMIPQNYYVPLPIEYNEMLLLYRKKNDKFPLFGSGMDDIDDDINDDIDDDIGIRGRTRETIDYLRKFDGIEIRRVVIGISRCQILNVHDLEDEAFSNVGILASRKWFS